MSAEGSVPAAGAFALTLMLSGCWANIERTPVIEWSPDRSRVAFARDRLCEKGPCETLFVGATTESAEALEGLAEGTEATHDIAWSKDGRRVGFLVNGRQLRIYDAESRKPAGKVNLFADDPASADRVARGITFSDNGAAITFDDCPRDRSGCRAGMIGVR